MLIRIQSLRVLGIVLILIGTLLGFNAQLQVRCSTARAPVKVTGRMRTTSFVFMVMKSLCPVGTRLCCFVNRQVIETH